MWNNTCEHEASSHFCRRPQLLLIPDQEELIADRADAVVLRNKSIPIYEADNFYREDWSLFKLSESVGKYLETNKYSSDHSNDI